jgi:hypothetical protein
MASEHLMALWPELCMWLTAGLVSGWLVGMYRSARLR